MIRKVVISLAALAFIALVITWGLDLHRAARDYGRISACMSHIHSVGVQLREYAQTLPEDENPSVKEAVDALVREGLIQPEDLACACSGTPWRFRGSLSLVRKATPERGPVIAYELWTNHHPSVGVVVLFANGEIEIIHRREGHRRLTGPEPPTEDASRTEP